MRTWDETTPMLAVDGLTIDARPEPNVFQFEDRRWVKVRIHLEHGEFAATVEGVLFPDDIEAFASDLDRLDSGGNASAVVEPSCSSSPTTT